MILTRGNATGPTRFGEIEWEWRKKSGEAGSMPTAEDAGADVAQVYDEVRAAIALGETMFPRGATSTDKSMQRYHSGWKETHGLYQTNKALRGSHEVEYEAFFGQDVADGLQEAWKRPMHWAGFLVMGASTRLPRGGMREGNAQGKRPASPLQDNSTKADGGLKTDEAGAVAAKNATVVSRLQNLEAILHGKTNNGMHTRTNTRARKHTHTHAHTHTHTKHTHTHTHHTQVCRHYNG